MEYKVKTKVETNHMRKLFIAIIGFNSIARYGDALII